MLFRSQSYSYAPTLSNVWTSSSGGINTQSVLPNYYSIYTTHDAAANLYIGISDSTREMGPVSDNFFKSVVSVKNYLLNKDHFSSYTNYGVYISVVNPANNTFYSIRNPVNNTSFQNGSSFAISETFYYNSGGVSFLTALYKATFNCKLYNSTGDSILLTNGEVVSTLTKC